MSDPPSSQEAPLSQETPLLQETSATPPEDRRSFIAAIAAIATGTIAVLTPLVVGIATFLSPLFRRQKSPTVRIALLSQVPDDGMPRYFPVVTDREDAWSRYPQQRVGAVYLMRNASEEKPIAFSAKCPHAGCFIGYTAGEEEFKCPCHTSAFKLDGSRVNGDKEVAPRDMDSLPVELREIELGEGELATEVWVEFINFQTGHKQQIRTT